MLESLIYKGIITQHIVKLNDMLEHVVNMYIHNITFIAD